MTIENQQGADTAPVYTPKRPLLTVEQTTRAFPQFTVPAIRNLVFKSEDRTNSRGELIPGNGMARHKAVVRLGRKVYIDPAAFERWIAEQVGS